MAERERSEIRERIEDAYHAALRACDPEAATRRALTEMDLPERVRVLAIGKAAAAMARGAGEALGGRLIDGVAVSDHPSPVPPGVRLLIGSHPLPDTASVVAGVRLFEEAARYDVHLLLVLVSGGGSALAEVPRVPLTVEELAAASQRLMDAGVPIDELNTVRRHLSAIKDGGLLAACRIPVLTLLVSDVVDAAPSTIASGPTICDGTTGEDALAVFARHGVVPSDSVRAVLARPHTGVVDSANHRAIVIVDDTIAAEAAGAALDGARILTTRLQGEAAEVALDWLGRAPAGFSVMAGETTVHVSGEGVGGRNQHAALAAAIAIEGTDTTFAALGTDGRDGPTDAAGAVVDGATAGAIRAAGIDPVQTLARCDSYQALDAAGVLVRTGPTDTNVGDLWIIHR